MDLTGNLDHFLKTDFLILVSQHCQGTKFQGTRGSKFPILWNMKSEPPVFIKDQLIFCKGFESVLLISWEVITPSILTLNHAVSQKEVLLKCKV